LSSLTNANIIKPENAIFAGKGGKAIGYTMRYVPKNVPLCRIFTKTFKDKNNITPEMSLDLILNMQETVSHIHSKKILVVDLNEMNFLSCPKFKSVYFIDVDSYQTPSYPATALMESVRDRHMKPGIFTQDTDWFSFAVVSFQVFIGIHPFKGKHQSLKGFDARMSSNVSVFNKDVNVPKSCLSLKVLPSNWRDWYKAVFEDGKRCAPPSVGGEIIEVVTIIPAIANSTNFDIKDLFECDWDIVNYTPNFGKETTICTKGFRTNIGTHIDHETGVVGYYGGTSISASIEDDKIKLFNLSFQSNIKVDIEATEVMSSDGRIYAKQSDKILEMQFLGTDHNPIATAKVVGSVMEKATQLFSGVAIQNMLGTYYASIFPKEGLCVQCKLDSLQGYQIIDAKFEGGVLMIVGAKKGKYDRFMFVIEKNEVTQSRASSDIQSYGLNFTVLDNGICVSITDTEDVEVFSVKNINKVKVIQDKVINGGMRLFHDGNTVMFSDGKKMFSLKMK